MARAPTRSGCIVLLLAGVGLIVAKAIGVV
jgi:hypothetical protein